MASNQIVQVAVSQVAAPIPETLQQTGALVSAGATILSPGTSSVLTQLSDLTPLLQGAEPLSGITYSNGLATATASADHNIPIGDVVELTIAGAVPAAYNGTFLCTSTGAETFTYYPLSNPGGSASTPGGFTPEDVAELVAMATTFFAQTGPAISCYVLELGIQDPNDACEALANYLVANPNTEYEPGDSGYYYVYLLPRSFDSQPNLLSLLPTYDGDQAQTYFVTTMTLSTYNNYSDLWKNVVPIIETPEMGQYAQNLVTGVVQNEQTVQSFTIATAQSGSGSYAPSDTLTATGGTGTEPTFTVATTKAVAVTQDLGGSGTGSGPATWVGTTGTGTKVSGTCTVTSGVMSDPVITGGGSYTANPSVLTDEPVTVTGSGITCTGASVALVMGVATATNATIGNLSVVSPNPVATTDSGAGTGCTLNINWTPGGTATATTTNPHGIVDGDWFQLLGFEPLVWNGWYQAINGTTGSTLVFVVPNGRAAVTQEGEVVQNIATSPGVGTTEFQGAAVFYDIVSRNPGPANRMTAFAFDYMYGATPWPKQGLSALQLTLKQAAVNIIKTGAEGGISNACLYWGTTKDGRPIGYWYSVDWISINGHVDVANAVINGSNDEINPLYYTQPGINTLQDVLAATVKRAVTNGLAFQGQVVKTSLDATTLSNNISAGNYNGRLVVNAIPFLTYLSANPDDYAAETYNGLSVLYVTQNGFISIQINITVTDFVVQPGT